ncbi:MAG TPA: alpha/beta hydrolase [Actinomycetota bacterium]
MIDTKHRSVTDAGELAYLDEGDGPVVLLLHGFPTSSALWREFVPLLAGRFRVIAPDLMGSGDSLPAEGSSLDLAAHAAAIRSLLTHLDVDRFAAVGHGEGGGVAQLLALDGSGVDALVLIDSVAFDAWPSIEIRDAQQHRPMTPAIVETTVRSVFDAGMAHGERLPDEVFDAYLRPWRTDDGAARFVRVLAGIDGQGLEGREDELGAIGFPVLILWGEDDPSLPVAVAERLNDAMPSSTLGLLPGCGHLLPEEAPETIGPMIAGYLRARFLMEPHGHDHNEGVVMLQLERRPPWVDLAEDEADDWFVDPKEDESED